MKLWRATLAWAGNLTNFHGRATRDEFWWALPAIIALLALGCFAVFYGLSSVGLASRGVGQALGALAGWLVFLLPASLVVRRLHDIGRSGWWYAGLLALVVTAPVISYLSPFKLLHGALYLVMLVVVCLFMTKPGQREANKYGPPRETDSARLPGA